jgi:chromosome segregation ATPase
MHELRVLGIKIWCWVETPSIIFRLLSPIPQSPLSNSGQIKIKLSSSTLAVKSMTENNRMDRMEDQLIDMRLAVSALLETVTQHQRNFETIQRNFETTNNRFVAIISEIRDIRTDMQQTRTDMHQMRADMHQMRADMLEMQSEVRGLQTENNRILDILQNRNTDGDS